MWLVVGALARYISSLLTDTRTQAGKIVTQQFRPRFSIMSSHTLRSALVCACHQEPATDRGIKCWCAAFSVEIFVSQNQELANRLERDKIIF